jgi:phosphatidylserine/phosphatidylglycerophosphate/cardiolipin synthase-like enzyme
MAKTTTARPAPISASNATDDPSKSLQTFNLLDLAQYTPEKSYTPEASKDFHLFFVGRDDVHDILKHVLSRARVSLYLNMFGYDDDEINDILMAKATDPNITMLITLDKSQAGGKHEKMLLDADRQHALAQFNTHFVIGQSATHQISHTKGFVADGKVGGEGSTNWSASGEGQFVVTDKPGGAGYKAQNNTQTIFSDPDSVNRFQTELIAEHMTAQNQENTVPAARRQKRLPVPPEAQQQG